MRADLIVNFRPESSSETGHFESSQGAELLNIIRPEIEKVTQTSELRTEPTETLVDLGTMLVQLVQTSSLLGKRLLENDQFIDYIKTNSRGDKPHRRPGDVDKFNQNYRQLSRLGIQLQEAADNITRFWHEEQSPPSPQLNTYTSTPSQLAISYILSPGSSPTAISSRRSASEMSLEHGMTVPLQRHPDGLEYVTNGSGLVDEAAVQINHILKTLKQRGKGEHRCPYGFECDKGGVSNGQLIVFERNSAFRSHCEKHTKGFRCDIPGCRNKTGFARRDQLERHQATVDHSKDIREHKRRKSEPETP